MSPSALTHPSPPNGGNPRARNDDEFIDRIARRVVELLREHDRAPSLLDAVEVARRLDRSREWVYRHADELGAVPLGDGERPRKGFPPEAVAAYLDRGDCVARSRPVGTANAEPERSPRRYRDETKRQGADLLPIRRAPAPENGGSIDGR